MNSGPTACTSCPPRRTDTTNWPSRLRRPAREGGRVGGVTAGRGRRQPGCTDGWPGAIDGCPASGSRWQQAAAVAAGRSPARSMLWPATGDPWATSRPIKKSAPVSSAMPPESPFRESALPICTHSARSSSTRGLTMLLCCTAGSNEWQVAAAGKLQELAGGRWHRAGRHSPSCRPWRRRRPSAGRERPGRCR